ncbi:RdgB/HAM1 family non-canonical purine NTP pyrophosphatase [Microbacterium sp. STN6]|uniref:RdgB/HAM1 family non-canonical purine NTP pyrophosphatase n=1 Tax=Microbacterium sp. STN6 TaxID=2995588 RepID=UPI002260A412|nr:RdgB/HAM1 family non-canonical purine NTP pyrophosphatase [Microbacterium sp. STN6]MCX7521992.1 RdgB/HAM1 family non-canonical purine NTP pyrophosphatase [Microbacterium sp. STN6]
MTLEVVLATHNQHKVEEFQKILGAAMPSLRILAYDGPEPVEDGTSFAENALIKARVAAAHTGLIALADDSGICVDVMGGAPGIFSARWAGSHGDARANLRLLLDQLADIREENRSASFHCSIALVVPAGLPQRLGESVVEGVWPGHVASVESGTNGFGYDPIFVPAGSDVSSAELSPEEKNAVSHRARAFEKLIPVLSAL